MKRHLYRTSVHWDAGAGPGTESYKSYSREHKIKSEGKPEIVATSAFHGSAHYNPEDLLIASLSSCHMLWYLHLCADAGIVVIDYEDRALGIMTENEDGSGQFLTVILKPRVRVKSEAMIEKANRLHRNANEMCFIARSCNFPVRHEPECYC